MDFAREEEIRLVKDEYNRSISSYNHDSFVLICKIRSRPLIEDHRDGARFIADEAIRARGCSKPLLVVRIGDANLLRFALHPNEFELKWVNAVFLITTIKRGQSRTPSVCRASCLSCSPAPI